MDVRMRLDGIEAGRRIAALSEALLDPSVTRAVIEGSCAVLQDRLNHRPRLYQVVRQERSITDRAFEIAFLAPGVEAYVFTFG
jgi:Thioredoxin like C-terminal domain